MPEFCRSERDGRILTVTIDRPEVMVRANGKRHGFDIKILVTGTLDNVEVFLSSSPALPPSDLLVLVSTGALPSTLANQGVQGNATLVGGYLLEELVDALPPGQDGALGFDPASGVQGLVDGHGRYGV